MHNHSIEEVRCVFAPTNIITISGFKNLIQGSERATNIVLFGGIKFNIDDVLYSTISKNNLLGFKNIQ